MLEADLDDDDPSSSYAPDRAQVAGGLLEGQAKAVEEAAGGMLKAARPTTRFILKRIPGAPALVYDIAEIARAPNKTRAVFGAVGGTLGGLGGAALGTAAGGVNAPIGAAIGATAGEGIGEQIYDEHRAAIDGFVDPRVAAARLAAQDADTAIRQGFGGVSSWLRARGEQIAGAPSR
jgi:hypothetical protein